MSYIVGIDAGGTKTDSVLLSEDMSMLHSIKTRGFNLTTDGIEKSFNIVSEIISEMASLFGSDKIPALCVAAAGAGRMKNEFTEYVSENLKENFPFLKVKVITDAEAALEGAFSGKPGFILIAGTGSVLFGKDNNGNYYRCGGYGRIVGDPGSGFSIGRKAFSYLSEVLDQIKEEGILSELLFSNYGINSIDDVIKLTNDTSFNFAETVPYIIEAANNKDKWALNILQKEAEKLCSLIHGMQNQTGTKEIEIAFYGSLISTDNIYSRMVKNIIDFNYKEVLLKKGEYPPAVGAAISVMKEL